MNKLKSRLLPTYLVYTGLAVFFVTVAALAFLGQNEHHYMGSDLIRHNKYKNLKDTRNLQQSSRNFTYYSHQRNKNNHRFRTPTTTNPVDTSVWVVTAETGIAIYIAPSQNSSIAGHIPKGAILMTSGRLPSHAPSKGYDSMETLSSSSSPFLHIIFPSIGWVSINNNNHGQSIGGNEGSTFYPSIIRVALERDRNCELSSMQTGYDNKGGDLNGFPLSSQSALDCCAQCVQSTSCSAWTFISTNHACWLKGPQAVSMKGDQSLISGIISRHSQTSTTYSFHRNAGGSIPPCCGPGSGTGAVTGQSANFSQFQSWETPVIPLATLISGMDIISTTDSSTTGTDRHTDSGDSTAPGKSLYTLKQSRDSLSWTSQWPIGTGAIGGLVGGTVEEEIIPLSISDLYITKKVRHRNPSKPSPARGMREAFRAAREELLGGHIDKAEKRMDELKDSTMGMFQYAADLALVFSTDQILPIVVSSGDTAESKERKDTPVKPSFFKFGGNSRKLPQVRGHRQLPQRHPAQPQTQLIHSERVQQTARTIVLDALRGKLQIRPTKTFSAHGPSGISPIISDPNIELMSDQRLGLGEGLLPMMPGSAGTPLSSQDVVHLSQGILDMRTGIVTADYLLEEDYSATASHKNTNQSLNSNQHADANSNSNSGDRIDEEGNLNRLSAQHREWFASQRYNVLVGTFTSTRFTQEPCLNFALQLSRQTNFEYGNQMTYKFNVSPLSELMVSSEDSSQIHLYSLFRELEETVNNIEDIFMLDFQFEQAGDDQDGMVPLPIINMFPNNNNNNQNPQQKSTNTEKKKTDENPIFVAVCGVVVCEDGHAVVISDSASGDILICNNASTADVIISMETALPDDRLNVHTTLETNDSEVGGQSSEKASSRGDTGEISARAKRRCWQRVATALKVGVRGVREQHMEQFIEKMERVQLSITTSNHSRVCANDVLPNKLTAFGSTCSSTDPSHSLTQSTTESSSSSSSQSATRLMQTHGVDAEIVTQAFHYGRYLMLSSATGSVPNLQGIWADGPTSAWSGDYHLNINLQMAYWASDAANMPETIPPLALLMKRMMERGAVTAKDMYGCPGWVGHGFTDNQLNMGMQGEIQWALCITCGAWMSLQLWDHLSYQFDSLFLFESVMDVMRGTMQFFVEYLFEDDGVMHTGPTTSPENSYSIIQNEQTLAELIEITKQLSKDISVAEVIALQQKKQQLLQQPNILVKVLALSPALDISILRQVGNVFKIAMNWAVLSRAPVSVDLKEGIDYDKGKYEKDSILVERFIKLVQRMPGEGIPVVDEATGLIKEYPSPLGSKTATLAFSEVHDLGHRHFSGMHWLYPGGFLPFTLSSTSQSQNAKISKQTLYAAAVSTMFAKSNDGGGHTSWSAAWQACLWARLRQPEQTWQSLSRVLKQYSSANLLSLHPQLERVGMEGCGTCFRDMSIMSDVSGTSYEADPERGLQTGQAWKFQFDGNMGTVAAVAEMLEQSHIPGVVSLLPSLPLALSERGVMKGMLVRGGGVVGMSWKDGDIEATQVMYSIGQSGLRWHPWLLGQVEGPVGFFRSAYERVDEWNQIISIEIRSPNRLQLQQDPPQHPSACQVSESSSGIANNHDLLSPTEPVQYYTKLHLKLATTVPLSQTKSLSTSKCIITLCGIEVSHKVCAASLKRLFRG